MSNLVKDHSEFDVASNYQGRILNGINKPYYGQFQDGSLLVIKNVSKRENKGHSHIKELLSGLINKYLTGRKSTPVIFLSHNKLGKGVKLLSPLLFNEKYQDDIEVQAEQAINLISFFNDKADDKEKGVKKSNLYDPLRTPSKDRPVKGFFESILVRIFLGDESRDIRFENMVILYQEKSYQIENVDFGRTFTVDEKKIIPVNKDLLNKEYLIKNVNEVAITNNENEDNSVAEWYKNFFLKASYKPNKEIKQTIKKIKKLTDQDLEGFINEVSTINDAFPGTIPQEKLDQCLTYLKRNRDLFQDIRIPIF